MPSFEEPSGLTTGVAHDRLVDVVEGIIAKARPGSRPADDAATVNVALHFGQKGTPVLAGDVCELPDLGLNGPVEIIAFSIGADQTGSCVVTIKAGSTLAGAANICGSNKPTLSSARQAGPSAPTGWTTVLADPTSIEAVVDSATDVEVVTVNLRCRKLGLGA